MATWYMATNGVDSAGRGSEALPWLTLQYSMANMLGGDTLIIEDGIYTGAGNSITRANTPPAGNSGSWTVIKSRNDGSVLFDGQTTQNMFFMYGFGDTQRSRYVQFEGLIWGKTGMSSDGQSGSNVYCSASYVKFLRCGAYDAQPDNSTNFFIPGSSYILLENCYGWGRGRMKFTIYQSDHCIIRNCVARPDAYICPREPVGGFSLYSVTNCEVQNCITIDADQDAYWSYATLDGAFQTPSTDAAAFAVNYNNCISLNNKCGGITTSQGFGAHGCTFNNCVIWDTIKLGASESVNLLFGPQTTVNHCTFGDSVSHYYYLNNWADPDASVTNSLIYGITGSGNYVEYAWGTKDYNNYYGCTNPPSLATHDHALDPIYNASTNPTGALKYITQIESGSNLKGLGENGTDIGANIKTLMGISGTLWGEPGYASDTGISMFPFPNEELIRSKMKVYTDGALSGDRGFCADGETLTHYIMNYLGNGNPYSNPGDNYSKGAVSSLPTDNSDLDSIFTANDVLSVASDDGTRVNIAGSENYLIHQFKVRNSRNTDSITITWNGQTEHDTSINPVYLQIYNHISGAWDTVASNNSSPINTDFNLLCNITSQVDRYYDASFVVSCRVYQSNAIL